MTEPSERDVDVVEDDDAEVTETERLKALPQRGDETSVAGVVVKAVSTPEGLEVTLRVPDEDKNPVGVGLPVDPQAYEYEGYDEDDDEADTDHHPLTTADLNKDAENDDDECEDCDDEKVTVR